jgi:hypothetical protein
MREIFAAHSFEKKVFKKNGKKFGMRKGKTLITSPDLNTRPGLLL